MSTGEQERRDDASYRDDESDQQQNDDRESGEDRPIVLVHHRVERRLVANDVIAARLTHCA